MEDFIAAINTIENNHQGYKRNILSALNNHGFSCTSLDAFLSLQAGKELPADAMLFEAFLPPRVLELDHDRLTASYGPSLASRPAFRMLHPFLCCKESECAEYSVVAIYKTDEDVECSEAIAAKKVIHIGLGAFLLDILWESVC